MDALAPLSVAAMALPPAVLRNDLGVLLTMARFASAVAKTIPVSEAPGPTAAGRAARAGPWCPHIPLVVSCAALQAGPQLQRPFSDLLEKVGITDPFIRNWLSLLCFLLQGMPPDGTMTVGGIVLWCPGL
jgi:hypothetical protein